MNFDLRKIFLAVLLSVASVGTVLADNIVPIQPTNPDGDRTIEPTFPVCPAAAGKVNAAYKDKGGAWVAFRLPLTTKPLWLWESLGIIMHDKDIHTEEQAMKRGQELLDAAWWNTVRPPILKVVKVPDAPPYYSPYYYFRCNYGLPEAYSALGDSVTLISVNFLYQDATTKQLSGKPVPATRGATGRDLQEMVNRMEQK